MATGTTVSDNTATNDGGGLISIQTMTLDGSTVSGNTAGARGGGIGNVGVLTLNTTEATQNTSPTGAGVINYDVVTIGPGSSVSKNIESDCVNGAGGTGCPPA